MPVIHCTLATLGLRWQTLKKAMYNRGDRSNNHCQSHPSVRTFNLINTCKTPTLGNKLTS